MDQIPTHILLQMQVRGQERRREEKRYKGIDKEADTVTNTNMQTYSQTNTTSMPSLRGTRILKAMEEQSLECRQWGVDEVWTIRRMI